MGKWLERAAALEPSSPDNSDNSANRSAPNVTNVTNVTIPGAARHGLAVLATAPAPCLRCPELWPQVVADATRLASEGWAAQALGLGWSELDVFGAVPDKHGDPDADGLAVKLDGRRVLAICANFATVSDGEGTRSFIYRGNNNGAVLLWDFRQYKSGRE